ncbi:putative EF-hand domain-containing protein [Helianthus debilis subsp. tardiflorus]
MQSPLRYKGLTPSLDQLDALIQKADTNSNGFVEFSEFMALVAPELLPAKSPYTDDQLKQFFKMLDRDGNGSLLLRLSWRIPWQSWDTR